MKTIKAVISIPQEREGDLLRTSNQLNCRTSGDISLVTSFDMTIIFRRNCSKTGGGVGVRKQIETNWGSNAVWERISNIGETVICSQKAVIKAQNGPDSYRNGTIFNKLQTRNHEKYVQFIQQQRLSFSIPAFSAQTFIPQAMQLKMRDVVVLKKQEIDTIIIIFGCGWTP